MKKAEIQDDGLKTAMLGIIAEHWDYRGQVYSFAEMESIFAPASLGDAIAELEEEGLIELYDAITHVGYRPVEQESEREAADHKQRTKGAGGDDLFAPADDQS